MGLYKGIELSQYKYIKSSKELIEKYKKEYSPLCHVRTDEENQGIICLDKSKFVGIIQWDINTKYIVALEIIPEYRHKGIATKLLRLAKQKGIKKLSANKNNTNAIKLYSSQKYKVKGKDDHMLYMALENAVLNETSPIINNKKGVFARIELKPKGVDLFYIFKKIKYWKLNPDFAHINHSDNPNCKLFIWDALNNPEEKKKITYVMVETIKDIDKGEEITINYNELPEEIREDIDDYLDDPICNKGAENIIKSNKAISENYMFSKDDLYINFDKWQKKKGQNILVITGLSGSGKSTLAKELANKHNATIVELDGLENDYDSSNIGLLEELKKRYPKYKEILSSNKSANISNEEHYKILKKSMIILLDIMKKNTDKLFILEGIQIYKKYLDPNKLKHYPIIIKETSALKSLFRRLKRPDKDGNKPTLKSLLKSNIFDLLDWYKWDEKKLSNFKKFVTEETAPVFYNTINSSIIKKYEFLPSKELIDKFKDQYSNLKHVKNGKENDGIVCLNKNKNQFVGIVQWDNNTKHIVALYVAPQYRNQGIATVLIRIANKRGIKKISVNKNNTNAIKLYSSQKYKVKGKDDHMLYMALENAEYSKSNGVFSLENLDNKNYSTNIGCLMIKEYYDEPWFINQNFINLNHSEDPNCKIKIEYSYNGDKEFIGITQIKPIKKNEEITINYNELPSDALDAFLNEGAVTLTESSRTSNKEYKCPFCNYHATKVKLVDHIDKIHQDMIPKGYTAARVLFNYFNHKDHGNCIICKRETKWNEDDWKYDRLCGREKCKDEYVKITRLRIKKIYGKENLLGDIEQQKKMLAGRSISGKYKFKDGGVKDYVGSYEKKLLEFFDKVLEVNSKYVYSPGPVIDYEFKGKKLEWITDFFYEPFNLVIEVKDGGNNPNNRNMEEYRAKQIAKEKAIRKLNKFNYIRLTNNNFKQLIEVMLKIKETLSQDRVISINEYMGLAAVGGMPSWNGENNSYIVPCYQNNSYVGSVFSDDKYLNKIYRIKDNKIVKDSIDYLYDFDFDIYKSKKKVDKIDEADLDKHNDYFFTLLTGKELLDENQFDFEDSLIKVENPYSNVINRLKNIQESLIYQFNMVDNSSFEFNLITEQELGIKENKLNKSKNIDIKKDINGYFLCNTVTNCRSKSYRTINEIPDIQYENIENMKL